jgi:hypothetical protein
MTPVAPTGPAATGHTVVHIERLVIDTSFADPTRPGELERTLVSRLTAPAPGDRRYGDSPMNRGNPGPRITPSMTTHEIELAVAAWLRDAIEARP